MSEKKNFKLHITNDENLSLKDLSEILDLINKSINDYYRDRGINNFNINEHATSINNVKEGSILIDIAVTIISEISLGLIVKYITSRLKVANKKGRCPIADRINIIAGNNNTINIHINN